MPSLSRFQSVICKDATWLGHGFLQKGLVEDHGGYLQRADSISDVTKQIKQVVDEISEHESILIILGEGLDEQQAEQKYINQQLTVAQQNIQQQYLKGPKI